MPFKSKAQNAWAHTPAGTKALGGAGAVKEWEGATDYSHLPQKLAKGGTVSDKQTGRNTKKSRQAMSDLIEDNYIAPSDMNPEGYATAEFAQGGPVRNANVDKHYKTKDRNEYGKFLSTKDRFTDGRKPAGFPEEAKTDEDWTKPKGVGLTDPDDCGDTKRLKPILPHTKEGHYDYSSSNRTDNEPSSPFWRPGRVD